GLRWRADEYRDRRGKGSGAHGPRHAARGPGGPRCLPRRPHSAQALRERFLARRRPGRRMTGTARAPGRQPFTVEPGPRAVRSFVLRQGRFTPAQQRAFDALWPRFGLDYQGIPRDFDSVFGRQAPRILEIGFGNGEALRHSAARDPERDHIGIEVHAPGVGRLLSALAQDDARNVRLYHPDAVEVLQNEVAAASLDEVRIYFPDPWHKKRHHKRRLVSHAFAALLVRKLAPGGRLHLATDW